MVDRVKWPRAMPGEFQSAFIRGVHERRLRLTLHTSSFSDMPAEEWEALEILRELSDHPHLEVADTVKGPHPHLAIDLTNESGSIPTVIQHDIGYRSAVIPQGHKLHQLAAAWSARNALGHPDTKAVYENLVVAQAHIALRQDVLVTYSPQLLQHLDEPAICEANPRTPSQAAQLVGLFLRSRGFYMHYNRGLFYWVLMRHRLPNMWLYFSACLAAEKSRADDTETLGQSILVRCGRALEARDAIGEQFYLPQDNSTRDTTLYHFDYLTLLLAGALDAQARIAHRAYGISKPHEQNASFRRKDYTDALKERGADALHELVSSQHCQDVLLLLYKLRNTVHGAALTGVGYSSSTEAEVSFIKVPRDEIEPLWNATGRCGSQERWGLAFNRPFVVIEPHTYATTLTHECFQLVDAVAAATDIRKLLPDSCSMPQLIDCPPEDQVFGEYVRKKLSLLG